MLPLLRANSTSSWCKASFIVDQFWVSRRGRSSAASSLEANLSLHPTLHKAQLSVNSDSHRCLMGPSTITIILKNSKLILIASPSRMRNLTRNKRLYFQRELSIFMDLSPELIAEDQNPQKEKLEKLRYLMSLERKAWGRN